MNEYRVFRSQTSPHAVALRDDIPTKDGDVLLSEDGVIFCEMTTPGFAGSTEDCKFTIKDPFKDREYEARRVGAVLTVHGERFQLEPGAMVGGVVPLPVVRVPEYLFKLDDGVLLYVSRAKHKSDYRDFKLFVGPARELLEVPVTRVERYRDGGTTVITTPAGVLFTPAQRRFDQPTWGGKPISGLDPVGFEIRESGSTVYVRSKVVC